MNVEQTWFESSFWNTLQLPVLRFPPPITEHCGTVAAAPKVEHLLPPRALLVPIAEHLPDGLSLSIDMTEQFTPSLRVALHCWVLSPLSVSVEQAPEPFTEQLGSGLVLHCVVSAPLVLQAALGGLPPPPPAVELKMSTTGALSIGST